MVSNSNLAVLERVDVLSLLADKEMQSLADSLYEMVFKPEETIYLKDSPAEACYIIKRGVVRHSNNEKTTALFKRGDLFGEMEVLDCDKNRVATAIAVTEVVLLAILKEDLLFFLNERPSVEMQIRNNILRRHAKNIATIFHNA